MSNIAQLCAIVVLQPALQLFFWHIFALSKRIWKCYYPTLSQVVKDVLKLYPPDTRLLFHFFDCSRFIPCLASSAPISASSVRSRTILLRIAQLLAFSCTPFIIVFMRQSGATSFPVPSRHDQLLFTSLFLTCSSFHAHIKNTSGSGYMCANTIALSFCYIYSQTSI